MTPRTWTLKLPWDRPPLSSNDRHANGIVERRKQTAASDAVTYLARSELRIGLQPFERVTVELVYYPGDNRTRDPDNIAATLKPVLDGLVDAGVIPDDKARHVVRTSQRIVLREDDPHGRKTAALYLLVEDATDLVLRQVEP